MKGFTIAPEMLIAVALVITAIALGYQFIYGGVIEDVATGRTFEYSECEYNADCSSDRLCISVDNSDYFCGCIDDENCASNNRRCVNNECVVR